MNTSPQNNNNHSNKNQFLLSHSMECPINIAMRQIKSTVFYFNENKIWSSISIEEGEHTLSGIQRYNQLFVHDKTLFVSALFLNYFVNTNKAYLRTAISKLLIGDTWDKFIDIYNHIEYKQREKPQDLNRFITKINRPIFERFPENNNSMTFDMIRMDINIVTTYIPEIMNELSFSQYIKKHSKKIKTLALYKLQESQQFQSYGIPITFLKLESAIYHHNLSMIEFIFTLKNL